jgi:hypothetical protein
VLRHQPLLSECAQVPITILLFAFISEKHGLYSQTIQVFRQASTG